MLMNKIAKSSEEYSKKYPSDRDHSYTFREYTAQNMHNCLIKPVLYYFKS